jgi:hypothetical protein
MMTKHLVPFALGIALLASPAFATKATHHCVDKDNKEIALSGPGKHSAQCKAAGGKWVSMKAATTTPPAKPAAAAPATPSAPPAPATPATPNK